MRPGEWVGHSFEKRKIDKRLSVVIFAGHAIALCRPAPRNPRVRMQTLGSAQKLFLRVDA